MADSTPRPGSCKHRSTRSRQAAACACTSVISKLSRGPAELGRPPTPGSCSAVRTPSGVPGCSRGRPVRAWPAETILAKRSPQALRMLSDRRMIVQPDNLPIGGLN